MRAVAHWDGYHSETFRIIERWKDGLLSWRLVTSYVKAPEALLQGIEHFYYVYVLTELYPIREIKHPVSFEPSLTHCGT